MVRVGTVRCIVAGMNFSLKQLLAAIPAVSVGFADEARAEAQDGACPSSDAGGDPYYDPCAGYDGWTQFSLLSSGAIPADGVLVLQASWRGAAMPDPSTATLTATTDGTPVAGTIEATTVPGRVIWRPAEAWVPGKTYTIEGSAQNLGELGTCLQAELVAGGSVTVEGASGPLTPVTITAVAMTAVVPTLSLETLACCPGFTPTVGSGGCNGETFVDFDPEQCAPFVGTGILKLDLTGTKAATGPIAQQLIYLLKAAGQPEFMEVEPVFGIYGLTAPQCATIDTLDLGTGAITAGVEKCFGDDVVAQLGPQVLDPGETLACNPQVCAPDASGEQWDLTMCTPYGGSGGEPTSGEPTESGGEGGASEASGEGSGGEDDDAKGCACAASGSDGPPLLMLAGVALLVRRRRR